MHFYSSHDGNCTVVGQLHGPVQESIPKHSRGGLGGNGVAKHIVISYVGRFITQMRQLQPADILNRHCCFAP